MADAIGVGTAATVGRFAGRDLLSILDHQGEHDHAEPPQRDPQP